jgi:fibronectin type 3 domain-containing protein
MPMRYGKRLRARLALAGALAVLSGMLVAVPAPVATAAVALSATRLKPHPSSRTAPEPFGRSRPRTTLMAGGTPVAMAEDSTVPANRAGAGRASAPITADDTTQTVPDSNLNTMWTHYGNQGGAGQWTGGDGTMSVQLPNGQDAWFFSDTFLGTVNADGSRPTDSPLIRNSAVLQTGQPGDSATLQTLIGGTTSYPTGLVMAPSDGQGSEYGYQAHAAWVNGNEVQVFYIHYATSGPGVLDSVPNSTAVATFSLPDLTLQTVTTLPLTASMLWGESVVTEGGYTYIYGNGNNDLYVARAPAGEVVDTAGSSPTDQWQFWNGTGWSSSESDATPVLVGVAGVSVEQLNGQYVLVTFDTETPFDNNIVGYSATAPTGPFTGKTYLYQVPPPSLPGGATCACFSYLAQLHPEFASSGELVISYNTDTLNPTENYSYVAIYRPRFIDVPWPVTTGDQPPDPPSGLAASSGADGVSLNWTASPTPGVSYWVYGQNQTTGESYPSRILSTTGTSALLSSLVNGDTYQFTVTAYDAGGESAPSNPETATPQVAPPSAAPADLTATANSDGSVTLAWQSVPEASWYDVQQEDVTLGATSYSPTAYSPTGTAVTITGLTVGNEYSFEVAAANSGGPGPYSQPVTAVITMNPPTAPTDLTGTANNDGTITLNWDAPSDGCPCWYNVYSSTDGGSTWSGPYLSTTNTWTGTYLTVGDTYTFYVEATNSGGASPPSNQISETSQMAVPSAPAGLAGTADATTGNINLSWNAPATGCAYGCWYNVYESADGGSTWTGPYLTTTNSWTAEYLTIGATYTFYVQALNAGGASPDSSQVRVTSQMAVPSAPTGLAGKQDLTTGNIDLSWTAPASGCPDGCWYDVYESADGGSTWTGPYLTTKNSFTAEYLTVGTAYTYYVQATNAGGASRPSSKVTVTAEISPPSAPTDLTGTADATTGNIDLSWTAPASGCPNGCYYNVYQSADGGSTWSGPYLSTTTSFTAEDLTIGTTYTYHVEATNGSPSASPPSNQVSVTAQMTAPSAPTDLTGQADANGDVSLSWTAPASGCANGCYYDVYESADGGSTWSGPYLSTTTSWTAEYLTSGTTYTYYVQATNAGGAGPDSSQISVTAYIPPTSAPANLAATPGNGQVSLTWSAPPGCSPSTCDYFVYYRDDGPGGTNTSGSFTSYLDTTTSADVTDLNNGDTYAFYVTASNGTQSAPSATVYATPEPPSPSAPKKLNLTSNNDGTIGISWTAPASGCPCWYLVYWRDIGPDDDTGSSAAYSHYLDKTTTGTLTFLNNGDYYEVYVVATNANPNPGPATSPHEAQSVIPPPTGLTATAESDGSIAVSWTAPAPGQYYNVYYQDTSLGTAVQKFLVYGTSATLTYLNLNDTYAVWVTSLGNNGWESAQAGPAYATSTITPPTLKVTSTTYDAINLSWTTPVPADDVWVYWRQNGTSSWNRFVAFVTGDHDTAQIGIPAVLEPDTEYNVKIATSQGIIRQSGYSNTVNAVTSSVLPNPADVSVTTIVPNGPYLQPSEWDGRGSDVYADCGSVAPCSLQVSWRVQPFISSYLVMWQDVDNPGGPWEAATAYPGPGSTITFDLPMFENGFMPGHRYTVIVASQEDGFSSGGFSGTVTFGDFYSQGAWGTDCFMSVVEPYVSGTSVVFSYSINCPHTSGGFDAMTADYAVDGDEQQFPGGDWGFCWTSVPCTFTRDAPLESGTHTYCFAALYSVFDIINGDDYATTVRIDGNITNTDECSEINS